MDLPLALRLHPLRLDADPQPIRAARLLRHPLHRGRITDVASGRLMWSARASAPPSADVNAQIADLSRSLLDAAGGAGVF